MRKGAIIEGNYRYSLTREWDSLNPRKAIFIMLNPSTADENVEDATTKKCIAFAKKWDCGSLEIVNIYAYKATNYKLLRNISKNEAIGLKNLAYLRMALETGSFIVAAWGENVKIHYNPSELKEIFDSYNLQCLGTTRKGHPRHPLYISGEKELEPYVIGTNVKNVVG